jgi:hypothetical protein
MRIKSGVDLVIVYGSDDCVVFKQVEVQGALIWAGTEAARVGTRRRGDACQHQMIGTRV